MQPYFDPTRKMTSKNKMEDGLKKKIKLKTTRKTRIDELKKMEYDLKKMEDDPQNNGRQPQKKMEDDPKKKWNMTQHKIEDDLQKWKTN
jgi:hypothetical protein